VIGPRIPILIPFLSFSHTQLSIDAANIMASNNFSTWDKLTKAQRDYPHWKTANAAVLKALKKLPKNPYLLVRGFCGRWWA
jgi:hypothetical protein